VVCTLPDAIRGRSASGADAARAAPPPAPDPASEAAKYRGGTPARANGYYTRMQIEPEAPTPRRVRRSGAKRGALAAVAALAGAALLSACGSSSSSTATSSVSGKTLDTARIALSIEDSILSQRHTHAKVTCPANQPQEPGHTFTCIATTTAYTTHEGKTTPTIVTTPFTVTVQNSRGYVTYHS
jgi:hypothetical protein